ncbi:MAG: metal-sensing transcriptional repressor [Lachnospiraceae bacterium]|nr:metal-sensing transcriptional repressor [Lachnospiraceae bacterium]
MSEEKSSASDVCACCRHKSTPRDTVEQKNLQNRINRIIGQLKGIQGMIEDNRYCGDVLIQIGAVESALQSLGYVMLKEHMMTCVAEGVQQGNTEILEEAVELMKKLK